jgi:hypothetical protein
VFFVCGLAAMGEWLAYVRPVLLRAAAIVVIGYNVLFLLQYQLFMRSRSRTVPRNGQEHPDRPIRRAVQGRAGLAQWLTRPRGLRGDGARQILVPQRRDSPIRLTPSATQPAGSAAESAA